MAAQRIKALCKCNGIYIRQVRVKHVELTLGYTEEFFNNGSMTMTFHILNVLGLGGHAKDGRNLQFGNGGESYFSHQLSDCLLA